MRDPSILLHKKKEKKTKGKMFLKESVLVSAAAHTITLFVAFSVEESLHVDYSCDHGCRFTGPYALTCRVRESRDLVQRGP